MEIFDLAILYLALGAPFAVSNYLTRRSILRSLGTLLIWPLEARTVVRRWLRSEPSPQVSDARTNRIREKLQRAVSAGELSPREFRDAFDRYVGLTLEVSRKEKVSETKARELLRISGREITSASVPSLTRRNAARLERHHIDARARFLELIEQSHDFSAMMLALELTTVLKDVEAQKYLDRVVSHGETRGEIWDSQKHTSSEERIAA